MASGIMASRLMALRGAFLAVLACLLALPALATTARADAFAGRVSVTYTPAGDAAAREAALLDAQAQVMSMVLQRLTSSRDHGRLPQASGPNVPGYVREVTVLTETDDGGGTRMDVRVSMRSDALTQMLDSLGLEYWTNRAPNLVLVAVDQRSGTPTLWGGVNPWLDAWGLDDHSGDLVPLLVPYGEIGDLRTITVEQAVAGDAVALQALANKYGAAGALVAIVRTDGIDLMAYGPEVPEIDIQVPVPAGGDLTTAVGAAVEALSRQWVDDNLVPSFDGPVSPIDLMVTFTNFQDWAEIRRRLTESPVIERIEVPTMAAGQAHVVIYHYADLSTATRELAAAGLEMQAGVPGPMSHSGYVLRLAPGVSPQAVVDGNVPQQPGQPLNLHIVPGPPGIVSEGDQGGQPGPAGSDFGISPDATSIPSLQFRPQQ